jgi:2-oxo-4-hydroxy-4-carboxy--5-ureidoimidazoline (OHCU) decarboxylase
MKKASEYRLHAKECRTLASAMDLPEQRQQMLQMAEHWEKLSMDRLELIERHPELAHDGEHDEERTWQSGLR